MKRADASVEQLGYYAMLPGFWGRSAGFQLRNKRGDTIDEVTATMKGEGPITLSREAPGGGVDDHSYPAYEIMTARGVTEVIEFRVPSDIFYVNDDPKIRAMLGVAPAGTPRKAN